MVRFVPFLFGIFLLVGCGGSRRHTVVTEGQGSLLGLRFIPLDHSLNGDVDTDPEIFWEGAFTPPSQFTVSLNRIDPSGDLEGVPTQLKRVGEKHWKLEVVGSLEEATFYAIVVRTEREQGEAWFLTESSPFRSRSTSPKIPKSGTTEHRIIWAPTAR